MIASDWAFTGSGDTTDRVGKLIVRSFLGYSWYENDNPSYSTFPAAAQMVGSRVLAIRQCAPPPIPGSN